MLLCTVETQHNCRMIRFNSGYYFSVFNLIGTLTRNPVFSELTVWSSLSPCKVLFIWIPYSPNINTVKIQTKSLWLFTEQSRFQSKVTPKSSPTITFFFWISNKIIPFIMYHFKKCTLITNLIRYVNIYEHIFDSC